MNLPLLERLVRLMAENDVTDLELEDGVSRIMLSRGGRLGAMGQMGSAPSTAAHQQAGAQMPMSPSATAVPATSGAGSAAPPPDSRGGSGTVEIKSPMVGTFYLSPSPDAKPFVQVGDRVGPDTDVCIIEAMKVFNEIPAEVRGKIAAVLCEEGEAVEFDKPLFKVDTSG